MLLQTVQWMETRDIKDKADALRRETGQLSAPIDVVSIAAAKGIRVYGATFRGNDISGMLRKNAGVTEILVAADHVYTRKRYTIAHELGHFILHGAGSREFVDTALDFYRRDDSTVHPAKKREEIQANIFASHLLMPTELLLQSLRVTRDPRALADLFKVSEIAMNFRIANLENDDF